MKGGEEWDCAVNGFMCLVLIPAGFTRLQTRLFLTARGETERGDHTIPEVGEEAGRKREICEEKPRGKKYIKEDVERRATTK